MRSITLEEHFATPEFFNVAGRESKTGPQQSAAATPR